MAKPVKTSKTNYGFDPKPSVAKALLSLRASNNLTQVEVADSIGVTPSTYARWEQEVNTPDVGDLLMLAATYNVTLNAFAPQEAIEQAKAALKKK